MLVKFLRSLLSSKASSAVASSTGKLDLKQELDEALQLLNDGKRKDSAEKLERLLSEYPEHPVVMNQLACAYGDLGKIKEAAELFVKSYTLDERLLPAILNHANLLMDNRDNTAALEIIETAKFAEPDFSAIPQAYSSYLFAEGRTAEVTPYKIRAWALTFDALRSANGYLFSCTYDHNMSEEILAMEHFFWAATMPVNDSSSSTPESVNLKSGQIQHRKIRIGYISADLRFHSVSYFIRPLLRGHNTEQFDLYIFDDTVIKDSVTDKIKNDAKLEYFDTSNLTDTEISTLIKDQKIDVLIELCGHTSHNRMSIFTQRLAPIQVNGLGYPPTTGLTDINFKFSDPWIHHQQDEIYYSESPLILRQSFWCFDPIIEIQESHNIPYDKNGYITFGCQGNIAKISDKMLAAWSEILTKKPNSKLCIRAINFMDRGVLERFESRVTSFGIPKDRLQLLPPAGHEAFFDSYNDIDIILDTFPFNGGTTTAFSLYMGTPVISLYGAALPSRMGYSMLCNMELGDLATTNLESYISLAVELSNNIDRLREIKKGARQTFQSSALGNGKLFAQDLEHALTEALKNPIPKKDPKQLPALPPDEIVRRGYLAYSYGNTDAAVRIARHCLDRYPHHAPAHVLFSTRLSEKGDILGAFNELTAQLSNSNLNDQQSLIINALRLARLLDPFPANTPDILQLASDLQPSDSIDQLQLSCLLKAFQLDYTGASEATPDSTHQASSDSDELIVIISTESADYFQTARETLLKSCTTSTRTNIQFIQSTFSERLNLLHNIQNQSNRTELGYNPTVLLINGDMLPVANDLPSVIVDHLKQCDVVSFAGSKMYDRPDWDHSPFNERAGAFVATSPEANTHHEMFLLGPETADLSFGYSVLSGKVLAFKMSALSMESMDDSLIRSGLIMEEAWTHSLSLAGCVLGVSLKFGCTQVGSNPPIDDNLTSGRNQLAQKLNWVAFPTPSSDRLVICVPSRSPEACRALIRSLIRK